jgi:PAS domain S-box-containing protein
VLNSSLTPSKSSRTLYRLFAAAWFILLGLLIAFVWNSRSDALWRAEENTRRTAALLEEHAHKVFETQELILTQMDSLIRGQKWSEIGGREDIERTLKATKSKVGQIASVWLTDASGQVHLGSDPFKPGLNVSDRDYFKAQKEKDAGTFISSAYMGRVRNTMTFALSRRRSSDNGEFDGTIHATVDADYFQQFWTRSSNDLNPAVALVRADGEVLARFPAIAEQHLRRAPTTTLMRAIAESDEGTVLIPTFDADGSTRLLSYRKVEGVPVYVAVSVDRAAVLTRWQHNILGIALAGAGALVALAVLGIFAIRRVKAQEAAEAALREHELRLRQVLDTAHNAFISTDAAGKIVEWNAAAVRIFGWPKGEAIGRPLPEIIIPERFRNAHQKGIERFLETGETHVIDHHIEQVALHRNGNEFPVELSVSVLRTAGGMLFNAFIQDISERKTRELALEESEARYRLLTESAQDLIVRMDPAGVLRYVSPASRSLLGYESEEVINKPFADYVHPDDLEALNARRGDLANSQSEHETLTYRVRHKAGHWVWVESRRSVVRDASGTPVKVVSVVRDVTQRQSRDEELHRAMEVAEVARLEAENASQAKSNFLASMSHEIRTPLNSIIGFSRLLSQANLPEQERRYAQNVCETSNTLLSLVNDILDFSKVEEGKTELENVPFSLREMGEHIRGLFLPTAVEKSLTLDLSISPHVPAFVEGDPVRLRQVLTNLVGNAVKFTHQGGVQISIKTQGDGDDIKVCFAVIDSGIGISKEKMSLLFQRFSQVDASTTREYGGTGLGLAICKGLVEAMGGDIQVESSPGKGSTFSFELNLPETASPQIAWDEEQVVISDRPARILLVDDVALNRELVLNLLSSDGHTIDTAVNGAEAVQKVQTSTYDLVLMDMQMPVMDGLEATRAIRSLKGSQAHVPIVALTANALPATVARCRSVGMNEHLAKPVTRSALVRAINTWTQKTPAVKDRPGHSDDDSQAARLRAELPRSLLASYLTDLCQRLEAVRSGGLDRSSLEHEAHRLVATAGQLGFLKLSDCCRELMEACSGPQQANLELYLLAVEQAAEEIQPVVDELKAKSAAVTA